MKQTIYTILEISNKNAIKDMIVLTFIGSMFHIIVILFLKFDASSPLFQLGD